MHRYGREMSLVRKTTSFGIESGDFDDSDEEETKKVVKLFDGVECNKSFYIFSKENCFRKTMDRIYIHRYFEKVILTAIIISSIKLAIDTFITDDTSTAA